MRMIERIAIAIANGTYGHPDTEPDERRAYRQLAIDVLDVMRKPNPEMIRAANVFCNHPPDHVFGEALIKYVINVAIAKGPLYEND